MPRVRQIECRQRDDDEEQKRHDLQHDRWSDGSINAGSTRQAMRQGVRCESSGRGGDSDPPRASSAAPAAPLALATCTGTGSTRHAEGVPKIEAHARTEGVKLSRAAAAHAADACTRAVRGVRGWCSLSVASTRVCCRGLRTAPHSRTAAEDCLLPPLARLHTSNTARRRGATAPHGSASPLPRHPQPR